jgi:hypothetical protein
VTNSVSARCDAGVLIMTTNDQNGNNNKTATEVDPLSIAVEQAAFVLELFEKGLTELELVDILGSEASLARAHILYFRALGWLEEDQSAKWRFSVSGKVNARIFTESIRDKQKSNSGEEPKTAA